MADDQSLAETAQMQDGGDPPASDKNRDVSTQRRFLSSSYTPIMIFCIAGLVLFVIAAFWIPWTNSVSLRTDDAYIRGDVTPLSTRERGIVSRTLVKDYQRVTQGQLLIELRNEDFRDRVDEADQSVSEARIKIEDMKSRKAKADAQIADAQAEVDNSREALKQFDARISMSKAEINEANANFAANEASIQQALASVKSAQADVVRSEKALKREEALLKEESSTNEKVEQVVNENERALASLSSQQAAREKAKAEAQSKQSLVIKAKQNLISVLQEQKRAISNLQSKEAKLTAAKMDRKLLDGEESQLKVGLRSKNAAADAAAIDLGYTSIKAPVEGYVGELKVKAGQYVNAGTQVISLVSNRPWIIANYRETQTARIKINDAAAIELDALPGQHWKGHVESIAPASGAQFSLLPPDNANGNFTKITQRIPVKIVFDEDQNLEQLRPGMSAIVTIHP